MKECKNSHSNAWTQDKMYGGSHEWERISVNEYIQILKKSNSSMKNSS